MKYYFSQYVIFIATLLTSTISFSQSGFPVGELTYVTAPPLTRAIDQNKPVYSIPAVLDVSNGNAQYTIPIKIPEGVNGMQPEISIGYNSGSGNGLLGYGWHLSASSSIERGRDEHVYDQQLFGPQLDNDDFLTLDGQRLVLDFGSNLSVGSRYRTGVETFQQIIMTIDGGFVVQQKNGLKRYYGMSANSRLDVTNSTSTSPVTWLLDKVEDRNGNKIVYEYIIDHVQNQYRLNKISYTEGEGLTVKAEVEFHYSGRNDEATSYRYGDAFVSRFILNHIKSTYDGQEYSKYNFNYTWRTGKNGRDFSRLVEVGYSSLGTEVNSTLIQWNPSQVESSFTTDIYPQYLSGGYGSKVIMDINGDGVDDVMSLESNVISDGTCDVVGDFKPPYSMHLYEFSVWSNVKNPSSGYFSRSQIISPFYSQYKRGECRRDAFCSIHTGDFNGDLLDDFVILRAQIHGAGKSSRNRYYIDFYINSPSSPGSFSKAKTIEVNNQLPFNYERTADWLDENEYAAAQYPFELIIGDFDADGISDVSYLGCSRPTTDSHITYLEFWNIHYINSDLTSQFVSVPTMLYDWGRIDRAQLGEFNGDGKLDIMFQNGSDSKIIIGENRTNWSVLYSDNFPTASHFARLGDFNGDGISDILYQPPGSNDFYIRLFNGEEFGSAVIDPSISYSLQMKTEFGEPFQSVLGEPIPFVLDTDMDGRDDIVFFTKLAGDYEINSYYNKVDGWSFSSTSVASNLVHGAPDIDNFALVDFDGSGRPQLFYFVNIFQGSNYGFLQTFRPYDQSLYVSKILDGFNRLTEFTYSLLTNSSIYSRSVKAYPNPTIMSPIRVVTNIDRKDFLGLLYESIGYQYDNLRVNLKGFGMLGYDLQTTLNYIQERRYETYRELISGSSGDSWPFVIAEVKNKHWSGTVLSTAEFIYSPTLKNTVGSDFNFEIRPLRTESKDYIWGTSSKQHFNSYDASGNVLSLTRTSYDNTNFSIPYVVQEGQTISYTSEGSWLDWQVEDRTITTTRHGQTAVSITESFSYDPVSGNLDQSDYQSGTPVEVVTDYGYGAGGNLISKTVSPTGMLSRSTNYTWTNDHRFIETITNPMTWVTHTYDYDLLLGVPTELTDQNNLKTEYQYDDLARVERVDYPDGNFTETSRIWDVTSTLAQSLFYVTTNGSNEPDKEVWYNGKLLNIREKYKNRNDDWVFTKTLYNFKRQLWKKSLPYFDGGQKQWIEYSYYDDGRLEDLITPTKTINKSYSGLTTTTQNVTTGVSTSQTMDASGLMLAATDNGGTISYSYNSFGQPTKISTSSMVINMEYDNYGRQENLSQAGAGIMTYEYDALGQLIQQIDAKNHVFTMTHDKLGRMTQKTGPDGSYGFTYDSNLKGPIYSASSPYQTSTSYSYDNYGKLTSLTEDVEGQQYEFFYDYNQDGNLLSVEYPNNLIIEYAYDGQGRVTEIRKADDQQLIWEYGDVNVMGQITEFGLGPNLNVTKDFDGTSRLLESYINPGNLELNYEFEPATGNLLGRENAITGNHETFKYDDLDRLQQQYYSSGGIYLPSGVNSIDVGYNDDGSIETKTDVGAYTNQNGQVTLIESNPNTISDDPQSLEYTPFNSVKAISEGTFEATFVYGHDDQRRKMRIENAGQTYIERYYLAGGQYERDFRGGTWRNLVYINTPTGQNAVYINEEGSHDFELHTLDIDHLGSIVGISDADGNLLEEYSYDAWGNRRNPQTWENEYTPGQNNNLWKGLLYRGYTGHEHLDCFGLINMNGRLYDPLLGRMLSPDNNIQNPGLTQNLNRFSYVLNNPLKYTDPSGEEWWHWAVAEVLTGGLLSATALTTGTALFSYASLITTDPVTAGVHAWGAGFVSGINNGNNIGEAMAEGDRRAGNSWDISLGIFNADNHSGDDWGAFDDWASRVTWQAPQTYLGMMAAQTTNMVFDSDVEYGYGATVVRTNGRQWGGVTFGHIIIGDDDIAADPNNGLFQHEYGHVLQSKDFGPWYFSVVGIPSALDKSTRADAGTGRDHSFNPAEQDANIRALNYFNKHVSGYTGWNHVGNPISPQYSLSDKPVQVQPGDIIFGPGILAAIINLITYNGRYGP